MDDPQSSRRKKRSRKRTVAVILAGAALGISCPYLPEHFQAPCQIAVKLLALFGA